ncbi:MAG: T9SS type A sorting domain-containing protein [Chloroherpetonaceae bacterium]|nr:T9SS type A sorting domain-containing protein [Chloroherpetonaceae bacterium]MDW8438407.1 T9SS type A sorting domain-containing protein [Chloroherpetonaceae bacterium]
MRFLILAWLFPFALSAQPKFVFNHALSFGSDLPTRKPASSHRVLAAMVEFQPDNDRRTTGTGVFGGLDYLASRGDTILDPYPHDFGYFSRKLQFLKNYFETVSNGRTTITFTLLPSVYRLSRQMSHYAPPRASQDFSRLAEMARETWRLIDSTTVVDFSQFDCFVIFHAGVGRDIDLVALTGTDPAPSDLPSITFKLDGFKRIYGQNFQGFPVNNGAARVANTLIIPSTEAREIDGATGKTLLELSTNGLLCASFGSYLGLPDLFNTENGRSGIGRFGLMDGEGFFNYNGAIPPEPSAWERIELGWATPFEIQGVDAFFKLPAQSLRLNPDSAIAKIPITSRECFLLENRQRNPRGTGVTLTIYRSGQTVQRAFLQDQDDFRFENLRALRGQVVACDNYDWTLPTAEVNRVRYNGGVLIWRIDDDIIEANRPQNRVNAGRIKGVKLLEADGSDDIGQDYDITSPGLGAQSGTVFDMFFKGNLAFPYRNFLDDRTTPSARSNRGAPSKIRISNFPAPAAVMDSIRLQRGDNLARVLNGFPKRLPDAFGGRAGILFADSLFVSGENALFVGALSQTLSRLDSATQKIAVADVRIGSQLFRVLAIANGRSISIVKIDANGNATRLSRRVESEISTAPALVVSSDSAAIAFGTASGKGFLLSLDDLQTLVERDFGARVVGLSVLPLSSPLSSRVAFFAENLIQGARTLSATKFVNRIPSAHSSNQGGEETLVALCDDKTLRIVRAQKPPVTVRLPASDIVRSQPIVAELENRGELAIVFAADDKIFAYNLQGFPISNFPILTNSSRSIASSPIVADIDGDTFADVIVQTPDGRLLAFNRFGKPLFALPIAEGTETTPTIAPSPSGQGLALFSVDKFGMLYGYEFPNATRNIEWGAFCGDNFNSNSYSPIRSSARASASVSEFLPEKSVFNYPNPASAETAFRFYLKESGTVTVRVFDMTGAKVWEGSKQSAGGFDDEIVWNARSAQSGVYYAVLTARSARGEEKTIRLKVAIVK